MESTLKIINQTKNLFNKLPAHINYEFKNQVLIECDSALGNIKLLKSNPDENLENRFEVCRKLLTSLSSFTYGNSRVALFKEISSLFNEKTEVPSDFEEIMIRFAKPQSDISQEKYFIKAKVLISFFSSSKWNALTQEVFDVSSSFINQRLNYRDCFIKIERAIEGTKEKLTTDDIRDIVYSLMPAFDRCESRNIYDALDVKFFEYVGGICDDTRLFCQNREGKIFHVDEIKLWGRGINSGGINDIVDGTWEGRIDVTDEETIFAFLGGWGCRHAIVPVNKRFVPPEVYKRMEELKIVDQKGE